MKDLSFRNLPRAPIALGATTPNPGSESLVWSTTTNSALLWNGSQWSALSSGGTTLVYSGTAPLDTGALWINTSDFTMNVYYMDGDSGQWVSVSGPELPPSAATASDAIAVSIALG